MIKSIKNVCKERIMLKRKNLRYAKIAVFAVAHNTYFGQFEGLYDNLMSFHGDFCKMAGANEVEIVDFGMVDTSEKAYAVAEISI